MGRRPSEKFDEINTSDGTRTPEVYITSHHITDTKEIQRKHKGNTKIHKITQKLHKRIINKTNYDNGCCVHGEVKNNLLCGFLYGIGACRM